MSKLNFAMDVPPVGTALKVRRGPKVTRLASTGLTHAFETWAATHEHSFDHTGLDGEWLIEFSGRECYQSFHNPAKRTTDEYVRNLINQGHYSVLEHASVTYRLEGISRSLTHELIRHRHFSFSQLSQRYVDSSDSWVVCPPLFLTDPTLYHRWEQIVQCQLADIREMEELVSEVYPDLKQKAVREAVRSVAPNALDTKLVLTGNLRTFREFLPKRLSETAEAEIQRLARAIHHDLLTLHPAVFEGLGTD